MKFTFYYIKRDGFNIKLNYFYINLKVFYIKYINYQKRLTVTKQIKSRHSSFFKKKLAHTKRDNEHKREVAL